jgi:hypothetical protein
MRDELLRRKTLMKEEKVHSTRGGFRKHAWTAGMCGGRTRCGEEGKARPMPRSGEVRVEPSHGLNGWDLGVEQQRRTLRQEG